MSWHWRRYTNAQAPQLAPFCGSYWTALWPGGASLGFTGMLLVPAEEVNVAKDSTLSKEPSALLSGL